MIPVRGGLSGNDGSLTAPARSPSPVEHPADLRSFCRSHFPCDGYAPSVPQPVHLIGNVGTRVRFARNNPEAGLLHGVLNARFGPEELSFALVGAKVVTRDTERAG